MIAVRESHVQLWPIERLVPYARNPRTHSEEQVTQIAASIAEFGFTNPILVDSQAGIIAGHGRLLAARKIRQANSTGKAHLYLACFQGDDLVMMRHAA